MNEREREKQIIDTLPEHKIRNLLLQGIQLDDEREDALYCERLVADYLDDDDPEKHETVSLDELAAREGIGL
jgi:DNA-binding LacI/PurR family transcriptional regulator